MPSSSPAELRRARPLLGTLVEIALPQDTLPQREAVQAAFAEIERLHGLMSFHDSSSDVSRLNREAATRAVTVAEATWQVLALAAGLAEASGGAFDISIAPVLQDWGFLPATPAAGPLPGNWRDIELLPDRRVRFRRPLRIDLGGIAKGCAVDRAAAVLEARGVRDYVINAGGDLRIGRRAEVVHLRHPGQPGSLLALPPLADLAVATSASYFTGQEAAGEWRHPIVVPATGRPAAGRGSVTVIAPACGPADALTKVVAVLGGEALPLLARYNARALLIDTTGGCQELGAAPSPGSPS